MRIEPFEMKARLAALWMFVLFNMLFRDMHEFARTGFLEEILAMTSNGAAIPELYLLGAAMVLQIPIGMLVLTQVLPLRANRWANLVAAVVMMGMVVNFNLAPDLDDAFFAVVECAALLLVIWHAWGWSVSNAPLETTRTPGKSERRREAAR